MTADKAGCGNCTAPGTWKCLVGSWHASHCEADYTSQALHNKQMAMAIMITPFIYFAFQQLVRLGKYFILIIC